MSFTSPNPADQEEHEVTARHREHAPERPGERSARSGEKGCGVEPGQDKGGERQGEDVGEAVHRQVDHGQQDEDRGGEQASSQATSPGRGAVT
ncbi:hypothetical protein [Streptomyces sp. NPDC048350]|uniref:hypothetical protein n=1 Tax=Streptomyces sp. NPDC048350 TaxID=3365538 RepID=UPI00371FFA05